LLRRLRQSPNISQDVGELQTSLNVITSHDEEMCGNLSGLRKKLRTSLNVNTSHD